MTLKFTTQFNKITQSLYLLIPSTVKNDSAFQDIFGDLLENLENGISISDSLELTLDTDKKQIVIKKLSNK